MLKSLKDLIKNIRKTLLDKKKENELYKKFNSDFELYNKLASPEQIAKKEFLYPCLYDNTNHTDIEPIYFYQDSWAFERIFITKPDEHIDIGSHHKFVAHLSKIVNLTMVDIRPLALPMDSIKFVQGSILELPFTDNSVASLSSICVIEHIGLGRYGDPIDPVGSKKAFIEINRVLKPGANFYISVPIEKSNKVYFNAHRAFEEKYLLDDLLSNYEVVDRKYIYGNKYTNEKENGFGIGLYHLKKK
jgi:SAM-dependent methyltransferase